MRVVAKDATTFGKPGRCGLFTLDRSKQSIIQAVHRLTLVLPAASGIGVVAKDTAALGRPGWRGLVTLAQEIAVVAIDAAAFGGPEQGVFFAFDGFALVVRAATGVGVVAEDAATLAQPEKLFPGVSDPFLKRPRWCAAGRWLRDETF